MSEPSQALAATHVGVIDADGHVYEDADDIIRRLPEPYRGEFEAGYLEPQLHLFPPLDHLHSFPIRRRGTFREGRSLGPDGWVRFLDDTKISKTVLFPGAGLFMGTVRDTEFAVAVARAYNDWISDAYVRHASGRFHAVAILPMQNPAAAADELRRAVSELGLSGGLVPTVGLPGTLGDERYWPLYAAADALGTPLTFHGGNFDGIGLEQLNAMAPAHALGHPFALLIALGSLVFNGVFDRFPRTRMGFLEGGAAWLMLATERFSESFGAFPPLVMPDTGGPLSPECRIEDYLVELVRSGRITSGCEGGEAHLAAAIEYFGTSPFMYSTDFPHESTAATCFHELEEFDELKLSDEQKRATLSVNAQRFYGIRL